MKVQWVNEVGCMFTRFAAITLSVALSISASIALADDGSRNLPVQSVSGSYTGKLNRIAANDAAGFNVYTHNLGPLELPEGFTADNSLIVEDTATHTFYFVRSTDVAGFAKLTPEQRQQAAKEHNLFAPILQSGNELRYDRKYNVGNALDGDPDTSPFPSPSEAEAMVDAVSVAVIADPEGAKVANDKYGMSGQDNTVFDKINTVSQVVSDVVLAVGSHPKSKIVPVKAAPTTRRAPATTGTGKTPPRSQKPSATKIDKTDTTLVQKEGQYDALFVDGIKRADGSVIVTGNSQRGRRSYQAHVAVVGDKMSIAGKRSKRKSSTAHFGILSSVKEKGTTVSANIAFVIDANIPEFKINRTRCLSCAAGVTAALRDNGIQVRGIRPSTLMKELHKGNVKDKNGKRIPVRTLTVGDASVEQIIRQAQRGELTLIGLGGAAIGEISAELLNALSKYYLECVYDQAEPVDSAK